MLKVTFIRHSCVLAETDQATLLFDYYGGTLPAISAGKPFYVLNSHIHWDHYSSEIFSLPQQTGVPVAQYLLSEDIREAVPKQASGAIRFLTPGLQESFGNLQLHTLASNDQGVAFCCTVDGRKIYHAGDLNDWYWDGDEEDRQLQVCYLQQLDLLAGEVFDVACIPFDPHLVRPELGVVEFMQKADARHIVPLHCWKRYAVIDQVRSLACCRAFRERICPVQQELQVLIQE